jgi:cobalamin-dependent methionine synthase I
MDDYSYIMAEALADRLAEALAEKLHEMVRQDMWGYSPDEKMATDDLLKVKYQVGGRVGAWVGEKRKEDGRQNGREDRV